MPTKATRPEDIRKIKEAIRLLNLALADCHRLLEEAEAAMGGNQQDNDPPANPRRL